MECTRGVVVVGGVPGTCESRGDGRCIGRIIAVPSPVALARAVDSRDRSEAALIGVDGRVVVDYMRTDRVDVTNGLVVVFISFLLSLLLLCCCTKPILTG